MTTSWNETKSTARSSEPSVASLVLNFTNTVQYSNRLNAKWAGTTRPRLRQRASTFAKATADRPAGPPKDLRRRVGAFFLRFSKIFRFPFYAIVVLTALASCTRRPAANVDSIPVRLEEAEKMLNRLRRNEESVRRYQAVIRIRGKGPAGRFSATQVIIFERPDRMRVELLGAFGSTRWVAVADQGEIVVWFPGRREYLRDTRVKKVVGVLLGVELGPSEVMAALAGTGVPLGSHGERPDRAIRRDGTIQIELGEARIEVEEDQVVFAQQTHYRVSYPTKWVESGRQVPARVDLSAENLQASLTIEDLDVNVPLHSKAFVVELPEDAETLALDEIGGEAVFVKPNR